MTKDEALNLALEALKQNHYYMIDAGLPNQSMLNKNFDAMITIKEALAQPEQEPKCGAIIEVFGKDWRLEYLSLPVGKHKLYTQQYTYTTPPQRKPLSDEEAQQIFAKHNCTISTHLAGILARAIEAKLKENT